MTQCLIDAFSFFCMACIRAFPTFFWNVGRVGVSGQQVLSGMDEDEKAAEHRFQRPAAQVERMHCGTGSDDPNAKYNSIGPRAIAHGNGLRYLSIKNNPGIEG